MSIQLKPTSTVLSVSMDKTEPLTVIKTEPPGSETVKIGIDDIRDSSDKEMIPDIKDIEIISNALSADIKSETVSENILENNNLESVETVFAKIENTPFIKKEDISDRNVNKSTGQGVIQFQGSNGDFNALGNLKLDKQLLVLKLSKDLSDFSRKINHSGKIEFSECYKAAETTSFEIKKEKDIGVPEIPYCCAKCAFVTRQSAKFKLHKLSHKTKAQLYDQHLKYQCDKCNFKTNKQSGINRHKLSHLKREQIQYVYCYHCSYKCMRKDQLRAHIFRHFKNEEIKFQCHICNFTTPNRDLIMEHFNNKKHEKRYCCATCAFVTEQYTEFKLHVLSHKRDAEMAYRRLKHSCDKCNYKTNKQSGLDRHKLKHLKLEQMQYFYCFHCSYKSKRKDHLRFHVVRHFKKEEITFHCYVCNFITLKRELINEHVKQHSSSNQVQIKTEINKETFW